MLSDFLIPLAITTAVGAGLNGGIFFAFSTFVMSALRRLPAPEGITAMQEINVTAVTAAFMSLFFGTAVLSVAVIVTAVADWSSPATALAVIGAAIYLVGAIGTTVTFNVPRNDALAAVNARAGDAAELWRRYHTSWTAGNHVRTVSCLAAAILLLVATRVG
ncbi:MAG: DUF1772 domain-containing protein [Gaiellaceae bacterium]